ncbi:glycosyltransferase [Hellea sp.]|nr:glycosyltransferase [Hellea sp.]
MTHMNTIPIYIGYDRRMPVTYHVAAHSIARRASHAVSFSPIIITALQKQGLMTRPLQANQSTEFSFSRFLVPYLMNYKGWAIFMDNDVVVLDDIVNLWKLRNDKYTVMCVKHDHIPENNIKFLGEQQLKYKKKNWSSVMLLNCSKCKILTPEYINSASGLDLHRFNWLEGDHLIGEIPHEWNFLIDYDPGELEDQKILHYTDGGPYYSTFENCQFSEVWVNERHHMLKATEKSLGEVFPNEVIKTI